MNASTRNLVIFLLMAISMFAVIVTVTFGSDMLIYHRLKHNTTNDWIDFAVGACINAGVPMIVEAYMRKKKRRSSARSVED